MFSSPAAALAVQTEFRKADTTYRRRRTFDRFYNYLRSCAVCSTALSPIDLLCALCWRDFSSIMNRTGKLKQPDYPFPVYSLLTWNTQNEAYVKKLIYGFKGGRAVGAAEKLATLFLSERFLSVSPSEQRDTNDVLLTQAPAKSFDHASLWAHALSIPLQTRAYSPFRERVASSKRQKQLRQAERSERRYEIREQFAGSFARPMSDSAREDQIFSKKPSSKRIVFADDVITSGATAMAAYMALGDPDQFEVWTLAARPRLAGKSRLC